jgi:hypothetical protein
MTGKDVRIADIRVFRFPDEDETAIGQAGDGQVRLVSQGIELAWVSAPVGLPSAPYRWKKMPEPSPS